MTTIHELAATLHTTPSHVAYAWREGTTIHGHTIETTDEEEWLAIPTANGEISEASVSDDTTAGVYPGVSFADYLAIDACNASSLKLARKSIAHMLVPRKESSAFDLGTSVHSLILEGLDAFRERTAIWPQTFMTKTGKESTSRNTTEAKEWKAQQEADGLLILDREEAELVKQVAKNVSECSAAANLLELATPRHACRELTILWDDPEHDVPCKMRADIVADETLLVDLKTCRSAHPDDFARDAVKHGYDLQAAHYWSGYEVTHGRAPDAYIILAVETQPPYGCAVYNLSDPACDWIDRGLWEREIAIETWAEWWHAGRPETKPYPETITPLQLPRWA